MDTLIIAAELAIAAFLLTTFVLSGRYRPVVRPPDSINSQRAKVAAIVPVCNEDPELFRLCIIGLLRQTRSIDEVYLIDDGSDSSACQQVADAFAQDHPHVTSYAFPDNRGKRRAQAWAVNQTDADILLTVDSDTILDVNALEEGLKPFHDKRVQGVCGRLRAASSRNLLTWLTDLQFAQVFTLRWAAYTLSGSVLSATGMLSLWRRHVLADNLDDYVHQRFRGARIEHGDDRRCTNYALRYGWVVYQESAAGITRVPNRLGHYIHQQSRWTKSILPEVCYAIRHLRPTRAAWWLSLEEGVLRIGLGALLTLGILTEPLLSSQLLLGYHLTGTLGIAAVNWHRGLALSTTQILMLPAYSLFGYLAWPGQLYHCLMPTSSWESDLSDAREWNVVIDRYAARGSVGQRPGLTAHVGDSTAYQQAISSSLMNL
ncbi:MAG: glycosyltransferase [Candidatus Bipolaricaulia bacterium]